MSYKTFEIELVLPRRALQLFEFELVTAGSTAKVFSKKLLTGHLNTTRALSG